MKFSKEAVRAAMLLYAITDRTWLRPGERLEDVCRTVLAHGATFLQLRDKGQPADALAQQATVLQALCTQYGVPFVVNDDVEVALAVGADGVHVGQSDIAGRDLRALLGADRILGMTARTVEQARAAEAAGADYIGVGAVFGTRTKQDARVLPPDTLRAIRAAVSIPIVAIGGIDADRLCQLRGSGVDGVAVVSAIFAADDPGAATAHLRARAQAMVQG